MKGRLVIMTYLSMLMLTACSKKDNQQEEFSSKNEQTAQSKNNDQVFISGWQLAANWQKTNSNDYTIQKSFSLPATQLKQESFVLVFARNVWEDDPVLQELGGNDEPLQMPFHFLPYFKEPGYTEHWNYKINEGKIDVVVNSNRPQAETVRRKPVEVQILVIPANLVSQKQQTKEALQQMSYKEVLRTFNLQS